MTNDADCVNDDVSAFGAPDDLGAALQSAWGLFERGVALRRVPFHTPAVASVSPDGSPEVRTVVLRSVTPADWQVRFHTDARSPKFASIAATPAIALHAYDAKLKVQVRLSGTASLHREDDLAELAWQRSLPMSRVCYAQHVAPGTPLADPLLPPVPAGTGEVHGRGNFVAVVVAVTRVEWLYLRASGHRRAVFSRTTDGVVDSGWLAP